VWAACVVVRSAPLEVDMFGQSELAIVYGHRFLAASDTAAQVCVGLFLCLSPSFSLSVYLCCDHLVVPAVSPDHSSHATLSIPLSVSLCYTAARALWLPVGPDGHTAGLPAADVTARSVLRTRPAPRHAQRSCIP